MPVIENKLHAIRSGRMNFGNAEPGRYRASYFSLQAMRLAVRTLALGT
ncbi:MAG: hypothetical protein ABIT23_09845 [Nitrosospira sp.]